LAFNRRYVKESMLSYLYTVCLFLCVLPWSLTRFSERYHHRWTKLAAKDGIFIRSFSLAPNHYRWRSWNYGQEVELGDVCLPV
jgi:hypothetical protein